MAFAFTDYLQSLGMGEVLINRVIRVHEFYGPILPEAIDDIFVNDYINEDTTRSYGSLWFFTPTYMCEARDWQTIDDWDLLRVARIRYWRLRKESFEFGDDATEASRFTLEFATRTNSGTLTAARDNCEQLRQILLKYFTSQMGEE